MTPRLLELQKRLAPKVGEVALVLATPAGKTLLEVLEAEFFNGDLLGATPEQTAFNLGAREVVVYLRQLRAFDERMKAGGTPQ